MARTSSNASTVVSRNGWSDAIPALLTTKSISPTVERAVGRTVLQTTCNVQQRVGWMCSECAKMQPARYNANQNPRNAESDRDDARRHLDKHQRLHAGRLSLLPRHLPEVNAERGAKNKILFLVLARPSCQRLPPPRVGLTCFGCSDVSNVEKHRGDLLLSTTLDKCVEVCLSPGNRNYICTCLNKSDATLKSNTCRRLAD